MKRKRSGAAWLATIAVLVCGLASFGGGFMGEDGFATRMETVTIFAALGLSLPGWASSRRWVACGAFLIVKLGLFFLLAPLGLRSLTLPYESIRDGGYWDDFLVYFWALPPLLLVVTVAESWLISVYSSGRTLVDTKLWKRRQPVGIVALVAVALGLGWWFGRVPWYLGRIRRGDAPAQYSLGRVGHRALPAIYREIRGLGSADVGSFRSDLVSVMADIRHDVVARRIDSVLVWNVEAAQVGVDPAMLDALRTAFMSEPEPKELENMANWSGRLDFDTQVQLFCSVFERIVPERQGELVLMIEPDVKLATEKPDPSSTTSPWTGRSEAQVADAQAHMRTKLGCVAPLLVAALERDAPSWRESADPLWGHQALRMLGRLAPLSDDGGRRLLALVPRLQSAYLTSVALENLWPELARVGGKPAPAVLEDMYRSEQTAEGRTAIRMWLGGKSRDPALKKDAFFCRTLAATPESELSMHMVWLVQSVSSPDPCVASALMQSLEKALLHDEPVSFDYAAAGWLAKQKARDPRITSWAHELAPRLDKGKRYRLEPLL